MYIEREHAHVRKKENKRETEHTTERERGQTDKRHMQRKGKREIERKEEAGRESRWTKKSKSLRVLEETCR